jgi:hypothetical protein
MSSILLYWRDRYTCSLECNENSFAKEDGDSMSIEVGALNFSDAPTIQSEFQYRLQALYEQPILQWQHPERQHP